MNQLKKAPANILFISTNGTCEARLAELLYESRANEMQVSTRATSGSIGSPEVDPAALIELAQGRGFSVVETPERLDQHALDACDAVILLGRKSGLAAFKSAFPDWKGSVDLWELPTEADSCLKAIETHVANLVVRLIMLGGKRTPIQTQPAPAASSSKTAKSAARVRVGLESKAGGKKVCIITGLPLDEDALKTLAARLKRVCGTGGTVKDGTIEIQGDKRDQLILELQKEGYQAKRSGG